MHKFNYYVYFIYSGLIPNVTVYFYYFAHNYFLSHMYEDVCSCPSPPANGYISNCNVTDVLGDTVEYSCKSGYYLVGSNTRTCQTGGNWTGSAPVCEEGVN